MQTDEMKQVNSQENVYQSPIEYDSWSYKKSLEIYKEDPFAMSNFLAFEGWQENCLLPPGWKFRPGLGPAIELLSSEEQTFPTLSSSLKYIKAHYSDKEVNNFKGFINPKTRNSLQLLEANAQDNMTNISGQKVVPDRVRLNKNEILEKEPVIIDCNEQNLNEKESKDEMNEIGSKINNEDESQVFLSKLKMPANVSQNVTITYVAKTFEAVSADKEAEGNSRLNKWITGNDNVSLPTGWKVEAKGIISPSGQLYKRKRNVLEYLLKTGGSQEAIRAIRSLMVEEGWRMETLPRGWMGKTVHPSGFKFIDSDGIFLENKNRAMNHLVQLDGDLKEQKLLEQFKGLPRKDNKHNDSNPPSWSKHPTQNLGELREAVDNVASWEKSPLLPPGWKLRAGKLLLRSVSGQSFTSHQEAAKYMEDKGSYSDKDIQRLYQVKEYNEPAKRKAFKEVEAKTKKLRLEDRLEGLEELEISSTNSPKVNRNKIKPNRNPQKSLSHEGKSNFDIMMIGSTRSMSVNQYQKLVENGDRKAILEAREGFKERFWTEDDILPPGWMFRTRLTTGTNFSFQFISESGQYFTSIREAKKDLEAIGDFRSLEPSALKAAATMDPNIEIKLLERSADTVEAKHNTLAVSTENKKAESSTVLDKTDLLSDFRDILEDISQFKKIINDSNEIIEELT